MIAFEVFESTDPTGAHLLGNMVTKIMDDSIRDSMLALSRILNLVSERRRRHAS